MKYLRTRASWFVATWLSLTAAGCATRPYSADEIDLHQVRTQIDRAARPVWTMTKPLLACVGNGMREARITPLLVGWGVVDTTGKTGVDQGLLVRSALNELARTGSGLRATSMGAAPNLPGPAVGQSPEERLRLWRMAQQGSTLAEPDWIIEGGVTSVVSSAAAQQRAAGIEARDVTATASRSRSFDEVRLSYAIKHWRDGVYIPGATWEGKVVYQQAGASVDLGAYVAFALDGRHHGFGVRGTGSDSFSESAEDAIRVGVETAIAMLFADQYGIDLDACATRPAGGVAQAGTAPTVAQLPEVYRSMTAAQRIEWVQRALAVRGYYTGGADGLDTLATRLAIGRFERDTGLPPGGGLVTLPLFAALAQARIAAGEDVRLPAGARAGAPEPVHIALSEPVGPYVVGQRMRAQVVAPQAGYLVCLLNSPDDGTVSIFPLIAGRPTFVSARTPLQLPSANESGAYPTITLAVPGAHSLYCAETRVDISGRLPATLGAGADGRRVSFTVAQAALRQAAGRDWIADGSAAFRVVPRR